MIEFTMNHKITSADSLNSIYAGKHWTNRKSKADYFHQLVVVALRKLPPMRPYDKPVMFEFWFNSRLDLDNHGFMVKTIIDGCKGIVIHDDTKRYVQAICMWYSERDEIRVRITKIE